MEQIIIQGVLYAIVIRRDFRTEGIHFFTPPEYSQQLAYMRRPSGYRIAPHFHREIMREVKQTQEVLFVRSGGVEVEFFDADKRQVGNCTLAQGDVILLLAGGHGFRMTSECELIEVKQGPYAGDQDKERFEPVS